MKRILVAMSLLLALSLPALAQVETFPPMHDPVTVVARHCQKYEHRSFPAIWRKHVDQAKCAADPSTVFFRKLVFNARTNAGRDWQAAQMGGTPGTACTYIAWTNDGTSVAADGSNTDTALTAEITTAGLSRALGTYAHTTATNQYTISKTFTATGAITAQKAGLFTAATSGTLCFEALVTTFTLASGDTVTYTHTINY